MIVPYGRLFIHSTSYKTQRRKRTASTVIYADIHYIEQSLIQNFATEKLITPRPRTIKTPGKPAIPK